MTDLLQALRDFTVTADYGREHTTFLVRPTGQSEPVVSMHKDYPHDVVVRPYYVRPAVGPDVLLGYVKMGKAWDAEQKDIGKVGGGRKPRHADHAQIVQHGLGVLTPKRLGAAGAVQRLAGAAESLGLDWLPGRKTADAALSAQLRCAGPDSAGFDLIRTAGLTAEYRIVVHDPQVSRLLILAFVERFNSDALDLRQTGVLLTTNPFANIAENRRMKLEKRQRDAL
jgi:hypothetical protein